MNVWLAEHLDLSLAARLGEGDTADVLVHSASLAKYRASGSSRPVSPVHWLDDDELRRYGAEKIEWDRRCRTTVASELAALCSTFSAVRIDPVFGGAIERLFFHCSQGCFDALAFALTHERARDEPAAPFRVIAGGFYRMKELVALVWWLAVCERFRPRGGEVEFFWTSRTRTPSRVGDVEELLRLLSRDNTVEARVEGCIPDDVRAGTQPASVAWVGALRYPRGWEGETGRFLPGPVATLRVAEWGACSLHDPPCLEMIAGNGGTHEMLLGLFNAAERALEQAAPVAESTERFIPEDLRGALERYFASGVGPYVLGHIGRTIDRLEEKLANVDVRAMLSTSAPFIESIALHEWARRRQVLPVLLPHSWTSSHEFPPESYASALTFVRSDKILPSAYYYPGSLAKEELVPLQPVAALHAGNSVRRPVATRTKTQALKLLLALPLEQQWRVLWSQVERVALARYRSRVFRRRTRQSALTIGYLLNFEHFEFTAGLDFSRLFRFLGSLADDLPRIAGDSGALLVLRRKALGWTNLHLLAWTVEKARQGRWPASMVISPDGQSLQEFGAGCDVVLYFQGTSAIPELMTMGVPVVQLAEPDAPAFLEIPYVELPEEVVPRMSMKELVGRAGSDRPWLNDLAQRQQQWIAAQMTS